MDRTMTVISVTLGRAFHYLDGVLPFRYVFSYAFMSRSCSIIGPAGILISVSRKVLCAMSVEYLEKT
jgi:hypothetical protein